LIYLIVSFLASAVGAVCGIGGGVIIKPVLDMFRMESVDTISFLSGCTVLVMSCYSVGKSLLAHEGRVNAAVGMPLAAGAVAGGIAGKQIFVVIKSVAADQNSVGLIQSACLGMITVGTLVYIKNRSRIRTYTMKDTFLCIVVGIILGVISSFLGIGGGPVNLVALWFFFGMDTKTASVNSLYIILFSQAASLLTTLVTNTIPDFQPQSLILMTAGGIGGGIAGRWFNRKMDNRAVDRLLLWLMTAIIGICMYNGFCYGAH